MNSDALSILSEQTTAHNNNMHLELSGIYKVHGCDSFKVVLILRVQDGCDLLQLKVNIKCMVSI